MSNYRGKTEFSKQGWIVRSIYLSDLAKASERSERRHNNIIGKTFVRKYFFKRYIVVVNEKLL